MSLGLQYGPILGTKWAQEAPKNFRGASKNSCVASPRALLIRCSFRTSFKTVLASILGGSGLDFRRCLDDFSSFLAYFGYVFACSCWGGYAPPDPPALALVSVVLGEVFSQRCQENPRTCRGQSRESKNLPRIKPRKKIRTDAYKKTNISKLCSSKLLSLSQPSLLQKLWAAVLPPRGASIYNINIK